MYTESLRKDGVGTYKYTQKVFLLKYRDSKTRESWLVLIGII